MALLERHKRRMKMGARFPFTDPNASEGNIAITESVDRIANPGLATACFVESLMLQRKRTPRREETPPRGSLEPEARNRTGPSREKRKCATTPHELSAGTRPEAGWHRRISWFQQTRWKGLYGYHSRATPLHREHPGITSWGSTAQRLDLPIACTR